MKRIYIPIMLILLACMCLVGCGKTENQAEDSEYTQISMSEAEKIFESNENLTIVDVRRLDEYEDGHIPGAINIPNESIGTAQPEELPDLNQTIYVYCRSGNRSKQAAEKLVDIGCTDIVDCGGIIDWKGDIE